MFTTLAPSKHPHTASMRAHTPRFSLSSGRKTLSLGSFSLVYLSWFIDPLTLSVAVPVWCLLRRYRECVFPDSRRVSVGCPPCSRWFSAAAPFSLSCFSPAARLAHTKVIAAATTAARRRGEQYAAGSEVSPQGRIVCLLSELKTNKAWIFKQLLCIAAPVGNKHRVVRHF